MVIPNPHGLELSDWADQVSFYLDAYGAMPKLLDDDWRGWASAVLSNHSLPCSNPPNPYIFDDWKDWARRFIESLL